MKNKSPTPGIAKKLQLSFDKQIRNADIYSKKTEFVSALYFENALAIFNKKLDEEKARELKVGDIKVYKAIMSISIFSRRSLCLGTFFKGFTKNPNGSYRTVRFFIPTDHLLPGYSEYVIFIRPKGRV